MAYSNGGPSCCSHSSCTSSLKVDREVTNYTIGRSEVSSSHGYHGRIGKIPAYHGLDPGSNPPWPSWFTGMQVKQTSHDLKATELAMTI